MNMPGLLDNNFLDPEVQAKRIAKQKRDAIIRAFHSADDARGVPRRNLSEDQIQQYLMTAQPLQDYVESASENPYMNNIPTQQDLWRKEAELSALEGPETANMQPSPYELTLLAENQQRHAPAPLLGVSNPDYPRFPAANQMGIAEGYDHQRINPPASLAGGMGPGQGLLDTPTRGQQPPLSEAVTKTNNRERGSRQGWEYNPAYQMMIQQGMKLYGGY
jgi:hypothetical protein